MNRRLRVPRLNRCLTSLSIETVYRKPPFEGPFVVVTSPYFSRYEWKVVVIVNFVGCRLCLVKRGSLREKSTKAPASFTLSYYSIGKKELL